jgi:hypothetical protein
MRAVSIVKRPVYCRVKADWEVCHKLGKFWFITRGHFFYGMYGIKGFIHDGNIVLDTVRVKFYSYIHAE